MNRLHRELAPISDAAWAALEAEAIEQLQRFLAARKLMEFHGPTGAVALGTGRVDAAPVEASDQRREVEVSAVGTVPMFELRRSFAIEHREIEALERGAVDVDLGALHEAARSIAAAEDRLVFDAAVGDGRGIATSTIHDPVEIPTDFADYPTVVAAAVATLRLAGVGGPYGLALGARCYQGVIETTEGGGIVVFDHLRKITGGPIVWAPTVDGAIVLSMQGGDHHLEAAEDLALGYRSHDIGRVELYLTETIGFRLDGDDAAVVLRHT